ncbi:MAG: hypothetical protein ACR2FV_10255 [Ornithinimicrobium sp.]|nr:hypothetical protein [Actinomycetota bacterium]
MAERPFVVRGHRDRLTWTVVGGSAELMADLLADPSLDAEAVDRSTAY